MPDISSGRTQFAEVLPPIFEDILKNVFKGEAFTSLLEGLQPEKEEEEFIISCPLFFVLVDDYMNYY